MSGKGPKLFRWVLYFILFCVLLRACGIITPTPHEHEWQVATCTEPKICADCGKTEGEPLGHDWEDATCTTPKMCRRCGMTDGTLSEHIWQPATCTEPETCSVCGKLNGKSSPLGHDWVPATLTSPMMCERCGMQEGQPLSQNLFSRGYYDRWGPRPSADLYVGMSGYVAVALNSFQYSSTDSPYQNRWFSTPWFATTYEKDKQFWVPVATVEHKTPVVVIGQELTPGNNGTYRYEGYLLVEQIDNGKQFYISVTDFVVTPYWESLDISSTVHSGPCLAEYHQFSEYYPVDRKNKKADIPDGAIVLIFDDTSWGGIDSETNSIDALTDNGRCFFNDADLKIIY